MSGDIFVKKTNMDSTHLHLILNHFPIIGTLLGAGVMAYGIFSRSESTKNAALWMWFFMALAAIPVFLTGEPAEESVEGIAGVSENLIEQHEEAAEIALWAMEALGLFSLILAIIRLRKADTAKAGVYLAFALSLVTFALMARTGYLGGQIRHSEIRSGIAASNPNNENEGGGEQGEGNEGEDDDD